MKSTEFQFISNYIFVFPTLVMKCSQVAPEKALSESITEICQTLISLDNRISKTLEELPKNEGALLVKDMQDYNNALAKIEQLLVAHRNDTLGCPEAVNLLKEGAPDYFQVVFDRDAAMINFGWLMEDLNEVFQQRSVSIKIWTRLNRMSRLIPLEFYSYPENATYVGYESPVFPPLKEKMTLN